MQIWSLMCQCTCNSPVVGLRLEADTQKRSYKVVHRTVDGRNPANQLRLVVEIPRFTGFFKFQMVHASSSCSSASYSSVQYS